MTVHSLHCQEPWFHLLRVGKKSVEGRLNKETCRLIKASDQIKFYNGDESFLLLVTKVQHFTTLSEYLETVGLELALPGIQTIKDGVAIYLKFYSEEEIQKHGIVAFFVSTQNVNIPNVIQNLAF